MLRRLVVTAGTTLAASFLIAGTAAAQTGVLSGAVFAGNSKTGLEGATVTVVGTKLSAVTGKDGRFTIANVPAGDQNLQIRRVEYLHLADRVRVAAGDTTHAYYALISPNDQTAEPRDVARTAEEAATLRELMEAGIAASKQRTAPLFVVDGVVLSSDAFMKDMNPSSIESIEVIKGAAATAKSGSRATDGAVIVTTKRTPRPPQD